MTVRHRTKVFCLAYEKDNPTAILVQFNYLLSSLGIYKAQYDWNAGVLKGIIPRDLLIYSAEQTIIIHTMANQILYVQ